MALKESDTSGVCGAEGLADAIAIQPGITHAIVIRPTDSGGDYEPVPLNASRGREEELRHGAHVRCATHGAREIRPVVGAISPVSIFTVVDFPDPFGPR